MLVYVFSFDLFEFSAAILEKGLLSILAPLIMLYARGLHVVFKPVDETLVCDHSNKSC